MAFIKEESGDIKIVEVFSIKHEDPEEQTNVAFINEETEGIRIKETFTIRYEDPESQTGASDKQSAIEDATNPKETFVTDKNYCYVCKKPQTKISRHLRRHQNSETEIAAAFSLPKHSKDRKQLLEKLRNRGNYQHNQEVIERKKGLLKIRRRPGSAELSAKTYVHCVYCKGLYIRKELWRHARRCPSKPEATSKAQVLVLSDIAESTFSQPISPEVWKILANMRNDDISSIVRNDFLLLQLSQCLYNKHGSDPSKSEYIRQKVREMGRLLVRLRRKYSMYSFEDAVKPNNFSKIVEAVKDVAGYDKKSRLYKAPSLALKLGRSLHKIGDIILCRAITVEDDVTTKAAERFIKLCSSEWAGHSFHGALCKQTKQFNKPSTIAFTQDVQLLHQYLEKKSAESYESLKKHESPQTYAELAKVTLARIIIFNRHCVEDVSKMTLECFEKRNQTELHKDIADALSPFEQKMAKHFSRVEIMGKQGRKVAVFLNTELERAIELLVEKRDACDIDVDNLFLFGRPMCSSTSFFSGQNCINLFVSQCGVKNLSSAQLGGKQVAIISQILSLNDNELDQLANFLGRDIRVHRDYYRLPKATIEIAKILKLLLAMEKGDLARSQGKSLDEIEIEDEINLDLDEEEHNGEDEEESDPANGEREAKSKIIVKRRWSANEVNAVMKHFKSHISKAHLVTTAQCKRCKAAEPVLRERTVQNIRDFVRNRGLQYKKKCS